MMDKRTYTQIMASTTIQRPNEEPVQLNLWFTIPDDERRHMLSIHARIEAELLEAMRKRQGPWGMTIGPLTIHDRPYSHGGFHPDDGIVKESPVDPEQEQG